MGHGSQVPFQACPPPPTTMAWTNITLRNIRILAPKQSPGVILGNPQRPMLGVLFDNVTVSPADPTKKPWGPQFYHCDGVHGIASRETLPLPPCFNLTGS